LAWFGGDSFSRENKGHLCHSRWSLLSTLCMIGRRAGAFSASPSLLGRRHASSALGGGCLGLYSFMSIRAFKRSKWHVIVCFSATPSSVCHELRFVHFDLVSKLVESRSVRSSSKQDDWSTSRATNQHASDITPKDSRGKDFRAGRFTASGSWSGVVALYIRR